MGMFYRPTADRFGKISAYCPRADVASSYFFQNTQPCLAMALIIWASKDAPSKAKLLKGEKISLREQPMKEQLPLCAIGGIRWLIGNLQAGDTVGLQRNSNMM